MPIGTSGPRFLSSPRRRIGAFALFLVLAATAVLAGIRVSFPEKWGCVVGLVSFASVDVPPDDATPEDVVRTYLRALDAHDGDTAAELYPPPNGPGSVACNVRAIDGVSVTSGVPSAEAQAGNGTVRVDAQFTIHVFDEAAAGQPDGRTGSNYYLHRQGLHGPWRIVSSGQG
ncbi:hypothetical protein GCM10011608_45930 [Micromonospora sonchi]|uniref:Uncharacterized protein n=1 Tax=Micromonospora sonchi TaxID=1763543 RepID=A0A917U3S6_9ACTN|nr:hypothetical protein [Micromonospora sonchi]GGM55901.1 hypothetical protein GCM10011608_45930 [Micromonospora sonchi]